MTNNPLNTLIEWLFESQSIAIMTGAGVSAESGISTFRDRQDGFWSKYDPMEMASPEGFAHNPELVWDWYQWRRRQVASAEPNPAHKAIATLQQLKTVGLITQNVDGLHQRAGSREIYELHGNLFRNHCNRVSCGYHESAADLEAPLTTCPECQSDYLRPSVVWFGESLNANTLERAHAISSSCDLFFSIGTSSEVYPAAGLADIAIIHGAKIVEINPNATALSSRADLLITEPAGATMEAVLSRFQSPD